MEGTISYHQNRKPLSKFVMTIEGREKIAHVWHCKKFKTSMTPGKENYVVSRDDTTGNDSWTPQGGRSTDVEEEGDFVDPHMGEGL